MTTTAPTPLASGPISPGDLFRARWAVRRSQAAALAVRKLPPLHGTAAIPEALTDVAGRPHDSS